MTFRKPVLTEAQNLLEDSVRKRLVVPTLEHAVDDAVVIFLEATFALP